MALTRVLQGILFFALIHNPVQAVQSVTLAWDPSPDLSVVGYNIQYGVASRTYTNMVDVGNATSASIPGLVEGTIYLFAATAYNSLGQESVFSNEASYAVPLTTNLPTITLTSPANGASYTSPTNISLSASVTANGHLITKVQFYNGATLLGEDTSAPYGFIWSNVSVGSYSLTARAIYDAGSTVASSLANVMVTNPTPTVALTSPASGAAYTAPATINLAAIVTANGHSITKVQYYNSATLLGEDTSSPYSLTWSNVSPGSYILSARAVYDTGSTVGSSSVAISVTSNAPPAGSAAAYGFNEGTGTTVGDASGNGNSGTVSGTSWTTTGRYGKALAFNGTSSYVNLGNPTPLHLTGSMTLEAWVLATGNPPDDGQIIAKSDSTASLVGWQFKTSPDTGVRTFGVAVSLDGNANVQRYSKTVPALNTWYHVAGVYNASARTLDIYVNGVLDDGVLNGTVPSAQFDPNLNVSVGKRGGGYYFNGTIDELRVYNRALSQAEIQRDMNAAIGTATNTAPTISALANQTINVGGTTGPIPFAVGDVETAAGSLTVSGTSSNLGLVPAGNIVFGGNGSNRTVPVNAAAGQTGSAVITVTVSDGQLNHSTSFTLMVNAVNPVPTVALTAPLSGASYTAPATINLAANVIANGHSITKVQFYNGATLLGEDLSAPYSLTWNTGSPGSYSLTAQAIYDAGSNVNSSPVNINVMGLPAPWQTADIGSVGVIGSASLANGIYTVEGAGNISGTADNFRFVYQSLSGDGEIKVRLNSVANTGTSGRIGVIIRESLTSGSRYAFMGISPDSTFRWQRRSNTSGSTSSTTSTTATPPNVWMRLVRTGNTLYGYKSTDGTTWTLVNSRSITMATNIYVGLAVASGSSTALNTSTFTSMTVVP